MTELSSRDRLRVALLSDQPYQPPAISPETVDVWTDELTGRYRHRARDLAQQRGSECFAVWARWDKLGQEEQDWLLELSAQLNPAETRRHITTLLKTDESSSTLIRAADRLEMPLPRTLLSHHDPEIRALAIARGLADKELEELLVLDSPLPVVLAAVIRCETDRMVGLLGDERWQVRSEALKVLSCSAPGPLEEVRALTQSSTLGTRAAAVELLLAWGDDEWLEKSFLPSGATP